MFTMNLKQAIELAKSRRYQEALPHFEKAYQSELDSFNEWDWYYYGQTLAKLDQLDAAIKINKFLFKKNPNFSANTNLYGRNLYKHVIKNAKNEEQFFSTAEFIIQNTKQERYSPYERTVLAVLKHLKDKPNTNYSQVLYWTEKLDPKLLSHEAFSFTDNNGKMRALASPLETWYQHRIKALFETKQYDESVSLIQKALIEIKDFHYNNDIWFRIKEAVSIARLGKIDEAIKRLHVISREKEHWTVYQELSNLYKEKEEFEKAIEMGAFALLERSGEFKHKIKLLLHMGDALEKTGQLKEALLHYCFVVKIRSENNWPVNQRIEDRIAMLKQDEGMPNNIKHELINFWKQVKLESLPKGTGIVKSLLPKGNAGFITSNTGEDLFFQVRNVKQRNINVNSNVSFYIINSYDQKKQRESKEAIEIKII